MTSTGRHKYLAQRHFTSLQFATRVLPCFRDTMSGRAQTPRWPGNVFTELACGTRPDALGVLGPLVRAFRSDCKVASYAAPADASRGLPRLCRLGRKLLSTPADVRTRSESEVIPASRCKQCLQAKPRQDPTGLSGRSTQDIALSAAGSVMCGGWIHDGRV